MSSIKKEFNFLIGLSQLPPTSMVIFLFMRLPMGEKFKKKKVFKNCVCMLTRDRILCLLEVGTGYSRSFK